VIRRFALAALLLATPMAAQDSLVTLDRLFGSRDFAGESFGPARWIGRGGAYTTLESGAIVRYDAASGARTVLVPAGAIQTPVEDYDLSPDGTHVLLYTKSERVWRQRTRGDYWLYDLSAHTARQLGGPAAKPSTLMFATFSPDSRRVAYVREHNLYVEDVAGGAIVALTSDGSPTTINGTFDWVYEEELNLRNGFRWSPDGSKIAYWQVDASGVRDYDLIDDTDSLYSFVEPVQYPKAGQTNSASRVGVVSASGGPTTWLTVPGDPRQNYIARMDWAPAGRGTDEVVLQHLDRRQHTLDVMLGNATTGVVRSIVTEHDSAWVDVVDDLRWVDGGKRFLWISDRDGWRHAYSIARDGSGARLLTPGTFDLAEPESPRAAPFVQAVDSAAGIVYFTASPGNATQLYLYKARLDGRGQPTRVTPAQAGFHHYQLSPDGRWAFHTFSTFDTPPTIDLIRLPSHEVVRTLVTNAHLKATVAALKRSRPEFFTVDSGGVSGGASMDGWLLKPPSFDATRKYPILFYVYGGSWDQTVLDQWSPQNLWHLMLAQQGYLVASIDNRGTSAPKGRLWRKVVYGRVGIIESDDQARAVRALEQRPYVDATRVAIWGWSNGGTMTLHALFRYPSLYGTGMSVAPVTDQRVYDTIYSERLMGLPSENDAGYTEASPVTYADSLRGNLLLVHGSGDDNVHFQNSELLINKLVAADKPFTLMVYPNRTHCICEGRGTRRHVFELLTRYLHDHVPPGPALSAAATGAAAAPGR
jgi:dipeptidyl-peptidase 4